MINNIYIIILDTILYGIYYCINIPGEYMDEINNIMNGDGFLLLKYLGVSLDFIKISVPYYFKSTEDFLEYPYQNIMGIFFFLTIITIMLENININIFPQEE